MAQTWWCEQGDGEPAVVVLSSLDDGQANGQVSTPCLAHWVGLCAAVVEAAGASLTWPEPDAGLSVLDAPEAAEAQSPSNSAVAAGVPGEMVAPLPESGSPDPMVTRVVKRGQTRPRSKAERGAMHAHLREAETGTESG